MDRLERYRGIVRRVIEEYASYKPSHGQIETEAIMDRDHATMKCCTSAGTAFAECTARWFTLIF